MPVSAAALRPVTDAIGSAVLVPVSPPMTLGQPGGGMTEDRMGKAPAMWSPGDGRWYPAPEWPAGFDIGVLLDRCLVPGGNVGLNLGAAGFVALDWDGPPQHADVAEAFMRALEQARDCGALDMRQTVMGRCATLLKIDDEVPRKATWLLRKGADEWKLELLGQGQQIVIAGTHASGNPIGWTVFGEGSHRPVPNLQQALRTPIGREALVTLVEDALRSIGATHGLEVITAAAGGGSALPPLSAEERRPPKAGLLLAALRDMRNPASVSRDDYMKVMLATAGCIAALRQDDAISLEQQEEAEHLAALWASRWEGPHPSAYEDERAKFRDDWSQQDVANLGWRWLRDFATQHGVQGLREEEARSEFRPVLPALEPAIDPRTGEELKNPIDVQDGTPSYADAMIARGVWAAAREVLAFDPFSERWMRWNGQRWLACSQTRGVEAEMIVRNLIAAYANRHGIEWSNTQMVQVATANRGPAVLAILRGALLPPQEFSHNALGLQTPTGSYDLRTGETVDAATARQWFDARCTAISPAAGETPLFDALLLHLCNGDAETVEWLWRCLGYGLLGDPRSQVFLSLVGEGATGKSTLLNVLLKIMGSYAGAIDADVLNTRGAAQHKASLFRLHDLRLAVLNEITKEGGRWNEARLKALTGGDEIEARQMHGPPRTFRFRGLLLVAGQKFPDFQQVDNAITRRVRIIGTEVPVPEHKRDTRLTDRLVMQEGPAILHRLIEQARLSYLDGCTVVEWPHRMRMTTNEIFGAMDRFVGWSQERLQAGPAAIGVETPVSDLRRDYQAWCSTQDEAWADDEMSEHRFTARLKGVAGLMVRNPDGRPLRKRFAHTGNNPVAYVKHGKLRDAAA